MATTETEIKQLRREIETLKKKVAQLQRRRNGKLRQKARKRKASVARPVVVSERERAREILRRAGITREMTPEEKKLAAEWRVLPAEEKRQVEETLRSVRLDPPLSQLIHEMRRWNWQIITLIRAPLSNDTLMNPAVFGFVKHATQAEGMTTDNPFKHSDLDQPE
jgi:hypothetical protein